MDLQKRLADLLDQESSAATRVDFGRLVNIQEEKKQLLAEIQQRDIRIEDSIVNKARTNLRLMRHLKQVMASIVGVQDATYNREGYMSESPHHLVRQSA